MTLHSGDLVGDRALHSLSEDSSRSPSGTSHSPSLSLVASGWESGHSQHSSFSLCSGLADHPRDPPDREQWVGGSDHGRVQRRKS